MDANGPLITNGTMLRRRGGEEEDIHGRSF
jgi:hypothetical protein